MQAVSIISNLESVMPFLSIKEKKLRNYVLAHSQEILSLALKGLSLQAEASEATAVRFACKLGCKGYFNFKLSLSANLSANFYNEDPDTILDKIMSTDTSDSVLKKLGAFTVTSIQFITDIIDSQELDRATKLIRNVNEHERKIYLNGLGADSTPVRRPQVKFIRLDTPVIYYEDAYFQLESSLNMAGDDSLICFTTLGESTQLHQYINIASQKKAKTILITQHDNQELASKTTATLFVPAVGNSLRLISHTALIVQSLIVDTLFLSLALDDLPEIQEDVIEKNRISSELDYSMDNYKQGLEGDGKCDGQGGSDYFSFLISYLCGYI